MKKTLTMNLGGTVYHIDEDAYSLLDKYLANLRVCFQKEQGVDEIMKDFELRISEHFSEKNQEGYQVITITDVENVIAQMGKPEDLRVDSEDAVKEEPIKEEKPIQKKLFRNPDDKMLGGVASGIAAYLGVDATVVRLILLVLLFLPWGNFPVVFIYIVLWIVMPMARTTADKLAMRGERVTVENIGRTVTEGFEHISNRVNETVQSEKSRSLLKRIGDVLVGIIGIMIKMALVVFVIVFSPILFLLLIVLLAFIIAMIGMFFGGGAYLCRLIPDAWMTMTDAPMALAIPSIVCLILLIAIPLFGVVQAVLSYFFSSWKPLSVTLKWTLLGLWFVAFVVLAILFVQNHWLLPSLGMIV